MKYKKSFFNILIENSNQSILYNTISKNHILLKDNEKKYFINNNYNDNLIKKIKSELIEKKFIINYNLDEKKMFFKNYKYDPHIYAYIIIPTFNCNLNCNYCYQKKHISMSKNKLHFFQLLFNYINNDLQNNEVKKIIFQFYGGEPLLEYEKIMLFLKKIKLIILKKNIKLKIEIITNGMLLTEKKIKSFAEIADEIIYQVTIHNFENILYNYNNKYYQIFKILNKINFKNSQFTIRLDIDKNNINFIDEFCDIFIHFNLKDKVFLSLQQIIPWNNESYENYDKFNIFTNNEFSKNIEKIYNIALSKNIKLLDFNKRNYICSMMLSKTVKVINPEGLIFKCDGMSINDYYSIGNIKQNKNISYPEYCKIDYLDKNCLECNLLPICLGGCRLRSIEKRDFNLWVCKKDIIIENLKYNLFKKYKEKKEYNV